MIGNYTITSTRSLTILNALSNPVDGYHIAFTWVDDNGNARNSMIKIERAAASAEAVRAAIHAEIERIESWLT